MLLKDKVVLVTGASRGIGAATATLCAQNGAKVGVNYVNNASAASAVVAAITAQGGVARAIQADVTVAEQAKRLVQATTEQLGPIDVLVLNAGLSFKIAPFVELDFADFDKKYSGEIRASYFCCKEVVPAMIARQQGTIIAISSGLSEHPGEGFISHSASKAALNAFVRGLATELGPHGIRVNTVSPGLTLTDATAFIPAPHKQALAQKTPLRRNGEPEDIAGAVVLLASEHARFITGGYLPVDGGMTML